MSDKCKVVVITGASSGIGYAAAKLFAKKGFKVIACARRVDIIEQLKKELETSLIIPYKLDITDVNEINSLKQFIDTLPEGKIDILYNNAGQAMTMPALDCENDAIEQAFKVNVFGHMNICKALSSYVIKAKGTILFTGSIAGIIPIPFGSIYSSTKGAIHAYARGLHLEMKPFGVRVINVITGGVSTSISDTRKLPESSLYSFKEGIESFNYRANMVKYSNSQDPDDYVAEIYKDIISKKDPVDTYRGYLASASWFMSRFLPYWLLELLLIKKFKLDKAFEVIKSKAKRD